MTRPAAALRVLHLEDSSADAELISERLRIEGFAPHITRVHTADGFKAALAQPEEFDLVLADLALPSFDGMSALAFTRACAPELPFVFVSGTLGEEAAIEAIRRGATDYVIKHRMGRLAVAVRRAVAEVRERAERRAAEAALRESEARFRHLADSAPALIWTTDAEGAVSFANLHFERLFDRPAQDMLGRGWAKVILPDDLPSLRETVRGALADRRPFRTEVRVQDRDGAIRWVTAECVPRLDHDGRFLGFTGSAVDVTEGRLAAEQLEHRIETRTAELSQALGQLHEEILEREHAEEALRQAQKMEAVGQLTGGIAHDFNNLLTVVRGSLELLQRRFDQGRIDDLSRYLGPAQQAVRRAADLTQRLLAFARRQALDPKPVEPDKLVAGMAELVHRTIGPNIVLDLHLGDGVWAVLCDPNQLENALLNLCINARDAMPGGGTLTMSTADVRLGQADLAGEPALQPGDYVEIAVQDTGHGMSPDVLAHVFEPFFTTKPIGQGTGLGLSQVYGFVQQSGGLVRMRSEQGRGTAVQVWLPRHRGAAPAPRAPSPAESTPAPVADARILLVEDEPAVRALTVEALRDGGWEVLEAVDGPSGRAVLESPEPIDLLITDIGLPGLNGRQLADLAQTLRPQMPVLLITGYAGSALSDWSLQPGMEAISKPFTLDVLTARVRAMLAAGNARAA